MKHLLSTLVLVAAAAALSGCYYDPGYSYVRGSGNGGDAYYGAGSQATYVSPAYGYDYYGGYYGGGYYGCCYAPGVRVGISSAWYGQPRYRYRDGGRRDYSNHAGHWQDRGGRGDRDDRGHQHDSQGHGQQGTHGGGNQGSRGGGQGSSRGNHGGGGRGSYRGRGDDRH